MSWVIVLYSFRLVGGEYREWARESEKLFPKRIKVSVDSDMAIAISMSSHI